MKTERVKFYTCDVFTDQLFGGNQLAVVPEAGMLSETTMQNIAREFNYSETTFVLPAERPDSDFRVRIFTPARELPFAGHPTVGTAHVLAAIGRIIKANPESAKVDIVFEEGVGSVPVEVQLQSGRPVFASLRLDRPVEPGPEAPGAEDLAAVLGLTTEEIGQGELAPRALSCGVPFLMVPLRDSRSIERAVLNHPLWNERLAGFWAPDLYIFTLNDDSPAGIHARMFGPSVGVPEDSATGSAAVTLAGYLALFDPEIRSRDRAIFERTITQGVEMGRPSRLKIRGEKVAGEIVALEVGGPTVLVSEGELFL